MASNPEQVILELEGLVAIKRCSLCGTRYSAAGWRKLHLVGYQDQGEDYPPLEFRNCGCGTTLAIEPMPGE
jgi:hypothetical protein